MSPTKRQQFAAKLNSIMAEQDLTPSELAARMQSRLPNLRFNVVNISHYRAGRSTPRAKVLKALSTALGIDEAQLIPLDFHADETNLKGAQNAAGQRNLNVVDLGDGFAQLRLSEHVAWATAIKVIAIMKCLAEPT